MGSNSGVSSDEGLKQQRSRKTGPKGRKPMLKKKWQRRVVYKLTKRWLSCLRSKKKGDLDE